MTTAGASKCFLVTVDALSVIQFCILQFALLGIFVGMHIHPYGSHNVRQIRKSNNFIDDREIQSLQTKMTNIPKDHILYLQPFLFPLWTLEF